MAIAFARAKSISRAKGQSSVACSAYRSCEKLYDVRNEKVHDYSKKKGHISGGLELPDGLNMTREELWNLVEAYEKRIDARLSKEIIIAFPKEFSDEENTRLGQGIAKILAVEHKADGTEDCYPVQWDVHGPHIESEIDDNGEFVFDEKGNKKLQNNGNNHGHFMITERYWDFNNNTFSAKKDRDRNKKEWLAAKKLEIGEFMNSMLREKNLPEIDFRSWEERNLESIQKTGKELEKPQKHKGPAKTNSERKNKKQLARKKMNIRDEIKTLEDALAKMDKDAKAKTNANIPSKNKVEVYVPGSDNWQEDISKKVDKNVSKKQEEKKVAEKAKTIAASVNKVPEKNPEKKVHVSQPIRNIPAPIPVSSGNKASHNNAGPDIKCFICMPDGSDRCKYCQFREDEKTVENSGGYSR